MGVTPEIVRVDFLIAGGCFFISMISVTKSVPTNKRRSGLAVVNHHQYLLTREKILRNDNPAIIMYPPLSNSLPRWGESTEVAYFV